MRVRGAGLGGDVAGEVVRRWRCGDLGFLTMVWDCWRCGHRWEMATLLDPDSTLLKPSPSSFYFLSKLFLRLTKSSSAPAVPISAG